MKNLFYGILISSIAICSVAKAEDDFFNDLMVNEDMKEEIKEEQTVEKGQLDAAKLLESRPKMLQIQKQKKKIKVKETTVKEAAPIIYEQAPFGLLWMAPIKEIEYMKVALEPIEIKDNPNSYKATNLPKQLDDFREVIISFGKADALWLIRAYGKYIEDDSAASKGVAMYRKYYEMLDRKYGNADEIYTPVTVNLEEKISNDDGTTSTIIRQEEIDIGDEGFLKALVSGESVLYTTFKNEKVEVTLALLATGEGKTYIVIDYKNLSFEQKANEAIFDAL